MTAAGLPLFPLGTVLFPGLVLPLRVFEDRYRALVRHLMALPADAPREFGVIAIRRGWEVERAVPAPGESSAQQLAGNALTLYDVGCSAELRQISERSDGQFDIVTVGRRRFRVASVDPHAAPYLTAEVEWLPEERGEPGLAEALSPVVLGAFQRYLRLLRSQPETIGEQLPDDPNVLSYLVAATASITLADRQHLLDQPDTVARLRAERHLLAREVALLERVRALPVPLTELAVPSSPN